MLNIDRDGYDCDIENLKIVSSVSVSQELVVSIFVGDNEITSSDLMWILPSSRKLSRWSQIENLLTRYTFVNDISLDSIYCFKKAQYYLQEGIKKLDEGCEYKNLLGILLNQLFLLDCKKKRYSMPTMLFSLIIFCQSSSTYERVARSVLKNNKCDKCQSLVVLAKDIQTDHTYFNSLQRGGLCIATQETKFIYFHLCAIFEYIINNKDLESMFLKTNDHHNLLSQLTLLALESDTFNIDLNKICECGANSKKIYSFASLIMSNIILNNYTKFKNSECHKNKTDSSKKRKLTTLK
ncbi:unnamed protein product [Ceutorhynchus assimilis]|uniref:Uncharacterized protein n=1 Tax=Ceutorhynchus assimilis TaxID=467358 RepID=A0A9N9MYP3_9CUCU|nr:unnamed protein product [Ceutorhynchus assimilis]